jgi:crotonobetainyl-CoA:carnitine CoA-transferase CaiB-like acyl-CoA transferase
MGNAHPSIAPYALFNTAEGAVVLAVGNDRQLASLCQVLGAAALASDARYATNAERVRHREALHADLERHLAPGPAAHWAPRLTATPVPAGVANNLAGAFTAPPRSNSTRPSTARGADGGTVKLTRNPSFLSATPPTCRSAPPRLPAGRPITAPT